eukprot:m51a1_g7583 putative trafficking protein particle complex subunit 2-like (146) ;mRNA; f:193312-193889
MSGNKDFPVHCLAVVGKNNNPIYLRAFRDSDDKLRHHYTVHASLDVVEERVSSGGRADPYLGLLFPTDDSRVFGYLTATKVKFILVTDESFELREGHLKKFFKRIHTAYADAVCNPFHVMDGKIESRRFDQEVEAAVSDIAVAKP